MMSEINKLGPFDISKLNCKIVADVVVNNGALMVVSQVIDGKTTCAVIALRDLKIVCADCFKDGTGGDVTDTQLESL